MMTFFKHSRLGNFHEYLLIYPTACLNERESTMVMAKLIRGLSFYPVSRPYIPVVNLMIIAATG